MSMQTNKGNNDTTKSGNRKQTKKCNYCKYKRHLGSNCFKKYPNLRKDSSINNSTKEEE
jgi:hypothetical protein